MRHSLNDAVTKNVYLNTVKQQCFENKLYNVAERDFSKLI